MPVQKTTRALVSLFTFIAGVAAVLFCAGLAPLASLLVFPALTLALTASVLDSYDNAQD